MAAAFLARLEQPKWSPTPTLVSCQAGHPLFQQGVGLLAAEFQRPEAWKQLSRRHLGHHVSKSVTGMLPHRGAHDASYALQAELELRRLTADHVTGLTLDLRKCFNLLSRCTVRELLLNHGDAYWDIYHTPTSYWMFFFAPTVAAISPGPLEGIRGGKERHPLPGRGFGTGCNGQGTCRATTRYY